ncbi:flagellar basal-body MS-ring/collar protein FliF [Galbitalea soli]|uniref:Flagellar M-ring protein n=1 Tax=Galbitalea soli TaxID=1268042 RepID=A0A7C9PMR4_9MICO|nr:flagellar basal-body MS-ring/collar protein FliF [Galbitalea soli]NEM91173.1 flagellar M-ring protein FliF [Galbitalea soli]NYJ29862.1 flagellar M-ring protein FliF [Galbitalea soli]
MPAAINTTLRRLASAIREFTVAQRTIAIIGVIAIVVAAIALTAWLSKPSYSPLFSGLNGSDAQALVTQLQADGVQYELADGGSTILVPDANVNAERVKAAAAGLPSLKQGGYALLDKLGVTSSQWQEDVTYKRALEGELASTLEAMAGVQTASVRLAIPAQTVFTSQKQDPTASVFIQPQGGVTLTSDQVAAITHLTASSVPGLTPANVSVISADGTVLSASGTDATASTDKTTSAYQESVRTNVQNMLDRVLGVGNSSVVVAATLSNQTSQRVEKSYSIPTNAPAINEQSSTETYSGSGSAGATGVLGPDNIAVPSGTASGGAFVSTSGTKNNALDSVTQTSDIPAGAVTRQTVSVAVNSRVVKGVSAATITALVNSAAGIDPTRGDAVAVQMVAFPKATATAAAIALRQQQAAEGQANLVKIITTAVTVLGVLLALFMVLFMVGRMSRRRESTPIDLGELGVTSGGPGGFPGMFGSEQLAAPAPTRQLETPNTAALIGELPAPGSLDQMRADIDRLAETNPQRAADALRTLMDERAGV